METTFSDIVEPAVEPGTSNGSLPSPKTRAPGGGRKSFKPSPHQLCEVNRMAARGVSQADIASLLHIDPKTLRKHFRHQLNDARIEANFQVLDSLFEMATTGKKTSAAIFWAKTRCGFRTDGVTDESQPVAKVKASSKTALPPEHIPPPPGIEVYCNDGEPRFDL